MNQKTKDIRPSIRVAHHYRFPIEKNASEMNRIGYCYAFHLIDGGKGRITAASREVVVKKGDLIYFPPGMPHSFYSDPEQPLSSYNIYCECWTDTPLNTERHLVWGAAEMDPALLTPIQADTGLDELPPVLPLQHHRVMTELFAHTVIQHQKREAFSSEIAAGLLKAFILQLIQISRDAGVSDYRMKAVMDRIDKEAHAGSHYESFMKLSGLKKTQFHDLFKRTAGLSPKAYWTRALMKQAAAMLWESERSVTEIAEDLGYSSIHPFTKQFTAYYGVSPSLYRKRRDGADSR